VKALKDFIYESKNAFSDSLAGQVEREEFIAYLRKIWAQRKGFFLNAGESYRGYSLDPKYIFAYLQWCIDDDFIEEVKGNRLRLTWKGQNFVSRYYYLYFIFNHWTVQHTISVIISAVVAFFVSSLSK